MRKFFSKYKGNKTVGILSLFLFFALFNPFFKKYDYGAGWPLVLLLGLVLLFLAIKDFKIKRERVVGEKFFLLIFLGAVILSFIFSQTRNLGFSEVVAFGSMIPLYFLYAHSKIKWGEKFLKIMAVFTVLAVILGFIFYFYLSENRMFGPFFNLQYHSNVWPNAFGLFLIMTWPIFLIFSPKKGRWKTSILIGIVLSALLLTFSRGALIVFGGQIVLLFIYFFRRIKWKIILMALLTTMVSLAFFVNANLIRSLNFEVMDVSERITFSNGDELTSKQERLDFWRGAIDLVKEKPILGWGPFSFRDAYNPIQKTLLGSSDHPHNIFLKIAAENGLISMSAFLLFLLLGLHAVWSRFKGLSKKKKDYVYILGVAISGAFAHNLIDYNFNFIANWLLLFMLLIVVRSEVVGVRVRKRGAVTALILSIVIAIIVLYEGALLALDTVDYGKKYLDYSLYPRFHYSLQAEKALEDGDYEDGMVAIEKEISLNPIDSRAYFYQGVIFCSRDNPNFNLMECKKSLKRAIELNPLNDLEFYLEYGKALVQSKSKEEIIDFVNEITPILELYYTSVKNNLHYTAYTYNVEAADELTSLILPYANNAEKLDTGREEMLDAAKDLRQMIVF